MERLLGRYYEGQRVPKAYALAALQFGTSFPEATPEQWMEFAADLAGEAYRGGYVRGFEWSEREPTPLEYEPEVLADGLYPEWRFSRGLNYDGTEQIVMTIEEKERR